jgi:hypothetical protein
MARLMRFYGLTRACYRAMPHGEVEILTQLMVNAQRR